MAIGAGTIWRVRPAGSGSADTNGGGYDPTISGAGTIYNEQDSPQLALSDIACAGGTTTVTSATGGFTTAMIANGIYLTGGGATTGWYFILTRTDTNTITVDRDPTAITAGTGNVGGALATPKAIIDNANATNNKMVAGNTVYIRGAGTDDPASADYSAVAWYTPVSGDTTDGPCRVIGENGRPHIATQSLLWHNADYIHYENLYMKATSGGTATLGLISTGRRNVFINVYFNNNNVTNLECSMSADGVAAYFGCEFTSGSTFTSTTSGGVRSDETSLPLIVCNCYFHELGGRGIWADGNSTALVAINNIISECRGESIYIECIAETANCMIRNNTIDGGLDNGIEFTNSAMFGLSCINNNIISNHASGTGLVLPGSATLNDRYQDERHGYNCYYNNSGDVTNLTAIHSTDITTNPTYGGSGSEDWSVGTNMKALGSPGLNFAGSLTDTFQDIGAAQREEPAGGGGAPGSSNMSGGLL